MFHRCRLGNADNETLICDTGLICMSSMQGARVTLCVTVTARKKIGEKSDKTERLWTESTNTD